MSSIEIRCKIVKSAGLFEIRVKANSKTLIDINCVKHDYPEEELSSLKHTADWIQIKTDGKGFLNIHNDSIGVVNPFISSSSYISRYLRIEILECIVQAWEEKKTIIKTFENSLL